MKIWPKGSKNKRKPFLKFNKTQRKILISLGSQCSQLHNPEPKKASSQKFDLLEIMNEFVNFYY